MHREPMVHLYYAYKNTCRTDCDTLGIDRRRVITLRRGHVTTVFHDSNGNTIEPAAMRMVAKLKVRGSLVQEHIDDLRHDDEETWS